MAKVMTDRQLRAMRVRHNEHETDLRPVDIEDINQLLAEVERLRTNETALVAVCEGLLTAKHNLACRLMEAGLYGKPEDLNGFYNGTGVDGTNVQAFKAAEAALVKVRNEYGQVVL